MSPTEQAIAVGWPPDRAESFFEDVATHGAEVLLITGDVLVMRIRGARQSTYRDASTLCLARARKAMAHLVEYVRPAEYEQAWCEVRGCDKRAPCPEHVGGER